MGSVEVPQLGPTSQCQYPVCLYVSEKPIVREPGHEKQVWMKSISKQSLQNRLWKSLQVFLPIPSIDTIWRKSTCGGSVGRCPDLRQWVCLPGCVSRELSKCRTTGPSSSPAWYLLNLSPWETYLSFSLHIYKMKVRRRWPEENTRSKKYS